MISMIILKKRGPYLDRKSGGDGLLGKIKRLFSKEARDCYKGRIGEDTVIKILKGLDDSYYLVNDIVLPSSKGNIDHVLLTPKGIFAIETKNWDGKIICNSDKWRTRSKKTFFCKYFKADGSPSRQAISNAFKLSEFIKSELFHDTFRVWVEGLVVFTNPNATLELKDPSVRILRSSELIDYIKNYRSRGCLSDGDLQSIGNFIAKLANSE
jgi:hypothetical protein